MLTQLYYGYIKFRSANKQDIYTKNTIYQSHRNSYVFEHFQPTKKDIENHFKKFKPTLDQIKSLNLKVENVEDYRRTVQNNLTALFNRPFNMGTLTRYYDSIWPGYRTVPIFIKYNAALHKIGDPSMSLNQTSKYFYENQNEIYKIFEDNRSTRVGDPGNMEIATEIVSRKLEHLSNDDLRIVLKMIETNELFGLVTIQPYMMFIMGNLLFFNVYLPLHREGAFLLFMQNCVSKQQSFRNSYSLLTYNISRSIFLFTLPIVKSPWFKYGSITSFGLGLSTYMYALYLNKPIAAVFESTFFRQSVNKFLSHGVGLQNPWVDGFNDFMLKLSFDIGSFIGGMTSNFYRGIISKYADILKIVAAAADKGSSPSSSSGGNK